MIYLIHDVARQVYEEIRIAMPGIHTWEETSKSIRDMTTASVIRLMNMDNVTPEKSHALWFVDAYRKGWRYGETFNPFAVPHPTNPRMIPFSCLSKSSQNISAIVVSVVRMHSEKLADAFGLYREEKTEGDIIFSNARIESQVIHNLSRIPVDI